MNSEVNVELNGIITEIHASSGDQGAPVCRFVTVRTVRSYESGEDRAWRTEDVKVRMDGYSRPEEAAGLALGDIVRVKGTLSSIPADRGFTCTLCGEVASIPGIESFVVPSDIERISSAAETPGCDGDDPVSIAEALGDARERSNTIVVRHGVQAKAPMFDARRRTCAYQLKTDGGVTIYVRSFGDIALADNENMKDRFGEDGEGKGAVISLKGALRSKPGHVKRLRCRACGAVNETEDRIGTIEVVPSETEYEE